MVAKFEASEVSSRTANMPGSQRGQTTRVPAFPLSSPPTEDLTSFKPSNSGTAIPSTNPFLSSRSFAPSHSDDDSGSSSGRDEFHLERYSQDTNRNAKPLRLQNRHSPKPQPKKSALKADRKPRPGLNIVTNFSGQVTRAHTDGLVIDHVQSQRPRLGPRYVTSVVSAKAEHVSQSTMDLSLDNVHGLVLDNPQRSEGAGNGVQKSNSSKRRIGRQAVTRLQELQAARKKAGSSDNKGVRHLANPPFSARNGQPQVYDTSIAGNGRSPDARSIVIGLSVPESEADAHRSQKGGDSATPAQTPDTPAITITPAEESEPWNPVFLGKARPPSSIYSANPRNDRQTQGPSPPPVASIIQTRSGLVGENLPAVGASIASGAVVHRPLYSHDFDFDEEKDSDYAEDLRKNSSESRDHILAPEKEDGRHKSQGWWNLMLSPMLSRKGTIVDRDASNNIGIPPVPRIPTAVDSSKHNFVSSFSPDSPEPPRRLGLAGTRASMWFRWNPWEKERAPRPQEQSGGRSLEAPQENALSDRSVAVLLEPSPDNLGIGLAAEYYHACAVEQLSGNRYFECQNHSCAECLPQLHSLFDPNSPVLPLGEGRGVDRSVCEAKVTGTSASRVESGVTDRSEPEGLSPNMRQAGLAAVMKARAIETQEPPESAPRRFEPPVLTQKDTKGSLATTQRALNADSLRAERQYAPVPAAAPPRLTAPAVLSPGPVSPEMPRTMISQGAVPLVELPPQPIQNRSFDQTQATKTSSLRGQTQPSSIAIYNYANDAERGGAGSTAIAVYTSKAPIEPRSQRGIVDKASTAQTDQMRNGEDSGAPKKQGWLSKLRCPYRPKKAKEDPKSKTKRRRWTLIISSLLFLIVLACILLATFFTRRGDGTPVQSQWLNLTGYPPMPTGISTIARPDAVKEQSQCVAPATLWSCALPKESQGEMTPNNADQPNFRFQITFRNGTVPANMTIPVDSPSARSVRNQSRAEDPFTNDLFTPDPTPPSRADQIFMGNTTDNVTEPFQGEPTPFYMTFIPTFPIDPSNVTDTSTSGSRFVVRQATNTSNDIPAPDVLDDGSAAPANLLPTSPFPTSQPVQLYNRGQVDEHYGFYLYFDKAIFLQSTAPVDTSQFANNDGIEPEDEDGGSTRDQSKLRCTFSQTRFLVRIWTNPGFGATLLSPISGTNSTGSDNSSATNFNRPGSFPYPTTISLDRHGGNINKKAAYCYGMDDLQVIQTDIRSIVPELRNVGGQLINPAPPLVNGSVDAGTRSFDPQAGGIDGGTGGCECLWQNWN